MSYRKQCYDLSMMTPTQRVQALRQRRKALGLIRVEFYLSLEHAAKVRGYVSKLTKEKTK